MFSQTGTESIISQYETRRRRALSDQVKSGLNVLSMLIMRGGGQLQCYLWDCDDEQGPGRPECSILVSLYGRIDICVGRTNHGPELQVITETCCLGPLQLHSSSV